MRFNGICRFTQELLSTPGNSNMLFILPLLVFLSQLSSMNVITRKYFIAVNDVEWDYAPGNTNLAHPDKQRDTDQFLNASDSRIGGRYMKAIYFEYTDATFTTQIPKPASLGLLGPTIRGEIGNIIDIVFFNNATAKYSMHPHGVFYNKDNEGALYLDGTSGRFKSDDQVLPGQTVRLIWEVRKEDSPGPDDPNCIPWIYHSHVNTVKDTSTGVMGALVTCKKGVLDANNERTDIDVEYPLLIKIIDENLSWLLDDNIQQYCLNPSNCRSLQEDDDFVNSNYMRSINGYMFGHLPGLTACVGDKVQFYLIGMGNEFDVHSIYFHGMSMKYQHTRGDTVSVFTATFVSAETTPTLPGTWMISDVVDGNEKGGMSALFHTVAKCQTNNTKQDSETFGNIRRYYLAAEQIEWDYGPGGVDRFTGKYLTDPDSKSASLFDKSSSRIGGVYTKAQFVQYTDDTFKTPVQRSSAHAHLGIMGPVLRAEPGDLIWVQLKNNINHSITLLPHGMISRDVDGVGNGGMVKPGENYTYTFLVPNHILDDVDDDCLNFLYTSATDSGRDHHSGLVGQILICQKGYVNRSQSNRKEAFILLAHFDENKSFYIDHNIKTRLPSGNPVSLKSDEDFIASNLMFSVNGYSFGTMDLLDLCLGENITWYVAALGSELDVHPLTFDGNTFRHFGNNRNVHSLVAGNTAALYMTPDNLGEWLVMSNSNLARDGGAYALYTVKTCLGVPVEGTQNRGQDRHYFVAAEEIEWNYTPLERGLIDGIDLNDPNSDGNIFIKNDKDFIGHIYRKAVFREYTDFTYKVPKKRDVHERHLDILGPVLRAEIGDTITVFFMNKATHPFSMHPHGLLSSHDDSGRLYNGRGAVQPGRFVIYRWQVPERSGPGPNDPDCIPWLYYSALDPTKDTNSGLVGPLVICRPGTLDNSGKRKDVDREMFVYMSVFNENLSRYLDKNIELYAQNRIGTDYSNDPDFDESNKMHSVNGHLYGNNPDFVVEFNASVTWYFMALGSEIDLHTIHTHGNTFLHNSQGHRDDVISMFPGMAEAVDMKAVNPGTWLLHCHVLDHIEAGMETTYTVLERGKSIPPGGSLANTIIG